jgi:hypothetical protein
MLSLNAEMRRPDAEMGEQAPDAPEARPKREKPDYDALAQERTANLKTKTTGLWGRLKNGFGAAKDFVLTIDKRAAYRAGQAADAGMDAGRAVGRTAVAGVEAVGAGAKFVGDKAVELGQDIRQGARAAAEFGEEKVVSGIVATVDAGKYVYEQGKKGAEMTMEGINRGIEAVGNRYTEVKTGIRERFTKAREAILGTVEMIQYKAEQRKLNEFRAKEAEFAALAGISEQRMAEIKARAEQRLAAKGISSAESEPSEAGIAA